MFDLFLRHQLISSFSSILMHLPRKLPFCSHLCVEECHPGPCPSARECSKKVSAHAVPCGAHVVPCGAHVVPMWCHAVPMWCPCGAHAVPMWCHVVPMWCHAVPMWCPCGAHAVPMWCSCLPVTFLPMPMCFMPYITVSSDSCSATLFPLPSSRSPSAPRFHPSRSLFAVRAGGSRRSGSAHRCRLPAVMPAPLMWRHKAGKQEQEGAGEEVGRQESAPISRHLPPQLLLLVLPLLLALACLPAMLSASDWLPRGGRGRKRRRQRGGSWRRRRGKLEYWQRQQAR